jgi:transmembrane sensor
MANGPHLQIDIDAMAFAWQHFLHGETATDADWARYALWLEESPTHRAAADAVALLSDDLDCHRDALMDTADDARQSPDWLAEMAGAESSTGGKSWFTPRRIGAAAMAMVAAVALLIMVPRFMPDAAPAVSYATAKGSQRTVVLADGSKVFLNTDTRMSVRMQENERLVELASGEASFDVTHDAARPFVIGVGDSQVRVVGTNFNILRHNGRLAVTVRRGVVEVAAAGQPPHDAWADSARLTAGKQLIHDEGSGKAMIRDVDTRASFAWQQRQLVYQNQTLKDVALDLNRYFTVPVRLTDTKTATLRFSGILMLDKEETMLHRLEQFLPVTVTRTATDFALTARNAKK